MKNMDADNIAVIVGYCRTPFAKAAIPGSGKPPGLFADVDAIDMLVPVINSLLERTGIDPNAVTQLLTGCVHQEYTQGMNIARMAVLAERCNLPQTVTGTSVDMFCASSSKAIVMADGMIARTPDEVFIITGVQSMSQIPMGGINANLNSNVFGGNAAGFMDMAATAENVAKIYGITREEADAFSLRSHQKAAAAQDAGHYTNEIVSLKGLSLDNGVRRDTSMDSLARLSPMRDGGIVTPGGASQVTDGASGVLVTSQAFAKANHLPVLARIIGVGEVGLAPEVMGLGPVEASIKALKRAGLTMDDIDIVELNEAFAAQSIGVLRELEKRGYGIDERKLNIDGGAIAIGHPLGTTGARITGKAAELLNRENKRYALVTKCIGGGQGLSIVLENPNWSVDSSSGKKGAESGKRDSGKSNLAFNTAISSSMGM